MKFRKYNYILGEHLGDKMYSLFQTDMYNQIELTFNYLLKINSVWSRAKILTKCLHLQKVVGVNVLVNITVYLELESKWHQQPSTTYYPVFGLQAHPCNMCTELSALRIESQASTTCICLWLLLSTIKLMSKSEK